MNYRVIQVFAWLLFTTLSVYAQGQGSAPKEGDQVLFLVDDSSSMSNPAFAPPNAGTSRWDIVQSNFPSWVGRLGTNTHVGAVSVGGDCGSKPSINLPVGTSRDEVLNVIAGAHPQGATNLNAVLRASPSFFDDRISGAKHIVLFSDGENTCKPLGSSCDIAKELHRDHGIVIDIVAWVTNPSMVKEFKCVSEATGGLFTAPQTKREWTNISLPVLEPWRYVVMALSVLMLLFAAAIFYRHAYHALGWRTQPATIGGGLLLSLGALIAYILLFSRAELLAAVLGILVTAGILAIVARGSARPFGRLTGPRVLPSLFVAILFLGIAPAVNADPLAQCKKTVQGPPRFHHILAIDASGSVVDDIEQMKALLSCYGDMYTLPNEELTLIAFGLDNSGSARELSSFTIPDTGSTEILDQLLDDLKIQDPRKTKTYFRPLADVLNRFLGSVRMEPMVLIVSDGKSDGFLDAEKGIVSFKEVSFESFGMRGIYSAPGMKNWRVAVQGGSGLDLTALFQHPLVKSKAQSQGSILGSVIEPCLIDPRLIVRTDNTLALKPGWNPFGSSLDGSFTIAVNNDCATRFRSFRVELLAGGQKYQIGEVSNTLIDGHPRSFTFNASLQGNGQGFRDGVVQVVLYQGTSVQTIYPQSPAAITIEQESYLKAYAVPLTLLSIAALVLVASALYLKRRRVAKVQRRPEIVKVMGGHGVAIIRNQPVSIGGDGCGISVPGVAAGTVLGMVEWLGTPAEVNLQPANGFLIKIRGQDLEGNSNYRLGQPLQFIEKASGVVHDVTLLRASSKEIGFGPGLGGYGFADFDVSFTTTGNSASVGSFEGSAMPHQQNGSGNAVDTYI